MKVNKTGLLLFLIVLTGLALRWLLCLDDFLHPWDERFHALVAKHLQENALRPTLYAISPLNENTIDWRMSHIWLHKQPLPLWIIASSLHFFGNEEFFVRLPSLLLSTGSLLITFSLGRKLFNEQVGLLATFFQAVNGLMIEITSGRVATDHIDVFYLFFIQSAIWLTFKYKETKHIIYTVSVGITIGLAVLCKWLPALMVIPLFFILNYNRTSLKPAVKQCAIILCVSIFVFLPWQLYIHYTFPVYAKAEQMNNFNHLFYVLDQQTGPWFYYLDKIRVNYHDLIYIPLIWLVWKFIKSHNKEKAVLLTWIFLPILFFSFVQTKMQGYILFISPALFITTAAFLYLFFRLKSIKKYFRYTVVFVFMLLPCIYCIDRVFIKKYSGDRQAIIELKMNKKELNDKNTVVFNCANYPEAMFYFDCIAYGYMPAQQEINLLKNKKYSMYYFENGDYKKLKKIN